MTIQSLTINTLLAWTENENYGLDEVTDVNLKSNNKIEMQEKMYNKNF